MKEIFEGVFSDKGSIYTRNAVPGQRVYGETLVGEFREWVPDRSKLGAAILCGLKEFHIKKNSKVLYLGASTGTTVSHISDIASIVYAIEFADRVFPSLAALASKRKNIVPIFADSRKPEEYSWIEECDVVFIDVADPQETEIFIRNCDMFLKKESYGMISIKSQSIDVTKRPEDVYKKEIKKMTDSGYKVIQIIDLNPYEKCHGFVLVQKI